MGITAIEAIKNRHQRVGPLLVEPLDGGPRLVAMRKEHREVLIHEAQHGRVDPREVAPEFFDLERSPDQLALEHWPKESGAVFPKRCHACRRGAHRGGVLLGVLHYSRQRPRLRKEVHGKVSREDVFSQLRVERRSAFELHFFDPLADERCLVFEHPLDERGRARHRSERQQQHHQCRPKRPHGTGHE